MNHPIATWHQVHETAEVHELHDLPNVHLANFDVLRHPPDRLLSTLRRLARTRADNDLALFANVDVNTVILLQLLHSRTTRTYQHPYLVLRYHHLRHTRCLIPQIATRLCDRQRHVIQNLQSRQTSLLQSLAHHLKSNALHLDVHLQRSDTLTSASYLEVHVPGMVLSSLDIRQHLRSAARSSDQAHRYSRHRRRYRNASIHHRKCACANTTHRC